MPLIPDLAHLSAATTHALLSSHTSITRRALWPFQAEHCTDVDAASDWILEHEDELADADDLAAVVGEPTDAAPPAPAPAAPPAVPPADSSSGAGGGTAGAGGAAEATSGEVAAGASTAASHGVIEEVALDEVREWAVEDVVAMHAKGELAPHGLPPTIDTDVVRRWARAATVSVEVDPRRRIPTERLFSWMSWQRVGSAPPPHVIACRRPGCGALWAAPLVYDADAAAPAEVTDVDDMGLPLTEVAWRHKQAYCCTCDSCGATQCGACGSSPYHAGLDCEQYLTFRESTAEYAALRKQNAALVDFGATVDSLLHGDAADADVDAEAASAAYEAEMARLRADFVVGSKPYVAAESGTRVPLVRLLIDDVRAGMRDVFAVVQPFAQMTATERRSALPHLPPLPAAPEERHRGHFDDVLVARAPSAAKRDSGRGAAGGAGGAGGSGGVDGSDGSDEAKGGGSDADAAERALFERVQQRLGLLEAVDKGQPYVVIRLTLTASYPNAEPMVTIPVIGPAKQFDDAGVRNQVELVADEKLKVDSRRELGSPVTSFLRAVAGPLREYMVRDRKAEVEFRTSPGPRVHTRAGLLSRAAILRRFLGSDVRAFTEKLALPNVLSVQPVVNAELARAFLHEQASLGRKRGRPRDGGLVLAYHGTTAEATASIVRTGLRVPGARGHVRNGSAYGTGIYLAPEASTSMSYSTRSRRAKMLVCAALLGASQRVCAHDCCRCCC